MTEKPNIETGTSLKVKTLAGLHLSPIIDNVFKILLPQDTQRVEITRVTSFDNLSLRSFDVVGDFRNYATVRGQGKISHKGQSSILI